MANVNILLSDEREKNRTHYLPEIKKIHSAFHEAWRKIQSFYIDEINRYYQARRDGSFIAEPDSHGKIVNLNFVIEGTVIRQCTVKVDMAFFFPITDQYFGKVITNGITAKKLQRIKWGDRIFDFCPIYSSLPEQRLNPVYEVTDRRLSLSKGDITDDLGLVWNDMHKITSLSVCTIPSKYLIDYDLVGIYHYAKYTKTEDLDCVLFAETDNPYDESAIKVLRWLPQARRASRLYDRYGQNILKLDQARRASRLYDRYVQNILWLDRRGNLFFQLGYIKRDQNSDLHNYMINNNCRILFARCSNSKINIKGGINILSEENVWYPSSLINIPVNE